MPEKMLVFQWNSEEYGVLIKTVRGIIGKGGPGPLSTEKADETYRNFVERPLFVIGPHSLRTGWHDKQVVILENAGIQLALVVDKVVDIIPVSKTAVQSASQAANIGIWRLASCSKESGKLDCIISMSNVSKVESRL